MYVTVEIFLESVEKQRKVKRMRLRWYAEIPQEAYGCIEIE
jgi:hypothetical protein